MHATIDKIITVLFFFFKFACLYLSGNVHISKTKKSLKSSNLVLDLSASEKPDPELLK